MRRALLLILFSAGIIFSQQFRVNGVVLDGESGTALPFANVRLNGTASGTAANHKGRFTLKLDAGEYDLIFSYVGYKSRIRHISIPADSEILIKLEPEAVKLQDVVVNASEDPAYRIIREAIKRKKQNRAGLVNFEYDSYSKNIILSAGEVSLVEELFAKGYNKPGAWEKEIILSRFRTENVKKNMGSFTGNITGKYFIDFSADTLTVMMNQVYLPLAENAFDYYDYKLLKIFEYTDGVKYLIQVIPRSEIQPLLKGDILIDDKNYALNEIHLSNNEGIIFPFINNLKIDFVQQLAKYDKYYLPNYVKIESSLEVNFSNLLKVETLSLNQINVITNYKINAPVPDSILASVRPDGAKALKVVPAVLTRSEIDSMRAVPLTADETNAYAELDSTKKIEDKIKVSGPLAVLIPRDDNGEKSGGSPIMKAAGFIFSKTFFRDNRVDGIVLGAQHSGTVFERTLFYSASAGYSFGRKKWESSLAGELSLKNFIVDKINFSLFSRAQQWQMLNPYPDLFNSLAVLLGFEDNFNYYLSEGFSAGLEKRLGRKLTAGLKFISEREESLAEMKYQSLIAPSRFSRINPAVNEGFDRRASLNLVLGQDPQKYTPIPSDGLAAQIDLSDPGMGSDFSYRKIRVIGQLRFKTIYTELFVSPYMMIMLDAGMIDGEFGIQHLIAPNSALGFYSPFGSLKLLKPYDYAGDKMIALHAEHNWRTVPFQSLGLNFMTDLSIDFITGLSVLEVKNNSAYTIFPPTSKLYWETYATLSRILGVIRVDFAYNSERKFGATASLAVLF